MRCATQSSAERRVDSIRASLASRLLPPADSTTLSDKRGNDTVSDQAVASMLAAEARRSKELSMVLGPRAFLLEHQENQGRSVDAGRKVGDLNKTFLQNTIKSVESHNRREQVESAWRQHDLLKKLDSGDLLSSAPTEASSSTYSTGTHATALVHGTSSRAAENSPPHRKINKRARSPDGAAADGDALGAASLSSDGSSSDGSSSGASRSPTPERARPAARSSADQGDGAAGRDEMLSERDMWALRKAKAFAALSSGSAGYGSSTTEVGSSSSQTEDGQIKEPKRAKKDSKKDDKIDRKKHRTDHKKDRKERKEKKHKHKKSKC